MQVAELSAAVRSPWRNGGGQTRELLAWPAAGDWTLRISVADITTAGPFSTYPGIDRWIAVLGGDGIALSMDTSKPRTLAPSDLHMHAFAGECAVSCSLPGSATTDLNIMVSRAHWRARITPTLVSSRLSSAARFVGCFASSACEFHTPVPPHVAIYGAGLVWHMNDAGETLHIALGQAVPRGWWVEFLPLSPETTAAAYDRVRAPHD